MALSAQEFFRYLPVSACDEEWGLYVTGAGTMTVPPNNPYPLRIHPSTYHYVWPNWRTLPEFQILYITRGKGEFESLTSGLIDVTAGSVLITFPEMPHRYRPLPEIGWDEYWVGFNGEFPMRWMQSKILSPSKPKFSIGNDENISRCFATILDRIRGEPPGFRQLLAAGVIEILGILTDLDRLGSDQNSNRAVVRAAKVAIEKQCNKGPLQIGELAASVHLSESQFRRIFRQHTGMSPYQYFSQLRLYRAKEMLRGTAMSQKQVAYALGFQSPYYFSKTFKKLCGVSPSEFRKKVQADLIDRTDQKT